MHTTFNRGQLSRVQETDFVIDKGCEQSHAPPRMAPQTKSFWGEIGKGVLIACIVSVIAVPTTIAVMGAKIDQNSVDIGVQKGELAKVADGRIKDSERIVELIQKLNAQQEQIIEIKTQIKQVGTDVVTSKEMAAETRTDLRWIKDMMRAQAQQK